MQSSLKAEVSDLRIKAYSSVVKKKKKKSHYILISVESSTLLFNSETDRAWQKIPKPKSSAFSTVIVVYY